MLSKNEIKDIQSLGLKKQRAESGLFIAEGPKIVSELLGIIPHQVQRVFGTEDWVRENEDRLAGIPFSVVSPSELERLSQLQTPNKVVALLQQLEPKEPSGDTFTLYLDTIQDPGNFGTLVRIADWFGIKDIVCTPQSADLYNPKVVQSTMASIARTNVYYDEEGQWLKGQQVPVYAATLGGKSLYEFEKVSTGILLIGNESKGLNPDLVRAATEQLTIPRRGSAESLNAAVATGIILSHLLS
jgi:TrmH family RNA methyltransferase